jgi:hypothetical protein
MKDPGAAKAANSEIKGLISSGVNAARRKKAFEM